MHAYKEACMQTQIHTDGCTYRPADRRTDRQADVHTYVLTDRQADRQTDGHVWNCVHSARQPDRQPDSQTGSLAGRQRDVHECVHSDIRAHAHSGTYRVYVHVAFIRTCVRTVFYACMYTNTCTRRELADVDKDRQSGFRASRVSWFS